MNIEGEKFTWDPKDQSKENIALGIDLFGWPLVKEAMKQATTRQATGGVLIVTKVCQAAKTVTLKPIKE